MKTFFDLIREYIRELIGEKGIDLYNKLWDKVDLSEFDLSEDLELTINQTRNTIYRLDEHNLVSSIRKKDKEKGWYIYYWTFNYDHARILLLNLKRNTITKIKERIKNLEENDFYYCPRNCVVLNIEESMEHSFKCPECEQILAQKDNRTTVESLKRELKDLTEEIKNLNNSKFIEETTHKVEKSPEEEPEEKKPPKRRRRSTKRKAKKKAKPRKKTSRKRSKAKKRPKKKTKRKTPKKKTPKKKPKKPRKKSHKKIKRKKK